MATSGDHEKGSSVPEETELGHFCSPCKAEERHVNAVGYCVNCEEYLCQRCFDVHLIPSVTRKHKLLDRENIPTGYADDPNNERISRGCPRHANEVINFHCPTHSFIGCQFCSYSHQKTCKDVLCIPEVCQNLTNTTEYKEFAEKLAYFTILCMQTATEFEGKLQSIESFYAKIIAEIREFKKQLLEAVNNAEKNIVDRVNKTKEEDLRKASELNDKCKAILKENQNISTIVDRLQRSESDMYIAMVKTKEKLKAVETEISLVAQTSRTRRVSFKANTALFDELKTERALGNLTQAGIITYVEHNLDINIKSRTDTNTCRPIGSVLCDNTLVITDESNRSVKVVDITSNKLTSELKLSSVPLGVCKISDNEVAVAEVNKVVFVKTCPPPRIEREFAITSSSHGLGYCDNKLVLSYSRPPKVEVLDMQGNVLNTFVNDAQGQTLFDAPYHLTVNPNNKLIYVSNYFSNNIVCLKFDGTVVAKYSDSELQGSWQVITDDNGMVYVCGRDSHNIHQLTEDCKKVKVLLTKAYGMNNPKSISYDELRGKLYVGQYSRDNLKAYNLN